MRKDMLKGMMVFAGVALLLLQTAQAWALPAFARRYGLECTLCHTSVAQLTRAGWEFREAGYRMPKEIGEIPAVKAIPKEGDDAGDSAPLTNVSDYSDARITNTYTLENKTTAKGVATSNSGTLAFGGGSLNLLCGSFGTHYGSFIEASLPTNVTAGSDLFNTGMVEAVYGDAETGWMHVRLGLFSNLYGFGGSDRGIGSSALFRSGMNSQAVLGAHTLLLGGPGFTGSTAEGVEVGYYLRKTGTELSLHWNDGSYWSAGKLAGSIGNGYTDGGDESFTLTQFVGKENSLTFFGYDGDTLVYDPATLPKGFTPGANNPLVKDQYQRYAGWLNVWVVKDLVNVMGGGGYAIDAPTTAQVVNGANTIYYDTNCSFGSFAEADWHPTDRVGLGVRYDNTLPSTVANVRAPNGVQQYTLSVNWLAVDGLVVKPEFAHNETISGLSGVNIDNKLTTSAMYIW
jgi:hypothetical protein